jgi:hypothetical protein
MPCWTFGTEFGQVLQLGQMQSDVSKLQDIYGGQGLSSLPTFEPIRGSWKNPANWIWSTASKKVNLGVRAGST